MPSAVGVRRNGYKGGVTNNLTVRELEILDKFLEDGCSDKHLADHFGITYSTAKTHMVNMRRKMGYGTREQLAVNMLRRRFALAFEECMSVLEGV